MPSASTAASTSLAHLQPPGPTLGQSEPAVAPGSGRGVTNHEQPLEGWRLEPRWDPQAPDTASSSSNLAALAATTGCSSIGDGTQLAPEARAGLRPSARSGLPQLVPPILESTRVEPQLGSILLSCQLAVLPSFHRSTRFRHSSRLIGIPRPPAATCSERSEARLEPQQRRSPNASVSGHWATGPYTIFGQRDSTTGSTGCYRASGGR